MQHKSEQLQQLLLRCIDNRKIFGTSWCIRHNEDTWCGAAGNLTSESPYFIASVSKLFTTAIILKLRENGLLHLSDKIVEILPSEMLDGLHVYKNISYTGQLTIQHLLAHTSGLPDYFQQKPPQALSFQDQLLSGSDRFWNLSQVLQLNKTMQPLFPPGASGKANYSDTNFQLLGAVIEHLCEKPYARVVHEWIVLPLELKHTYVYQDITDETPMHLYAKQNPLIIPKAMTSFGPDGGIVSTSPEMIRFLYAFFNGVFFPVAVIDTLKTWNRIFFPMQSGIGIHRFSLPWILNPFGTVPELIGHSGLSGALAYCNPAKNLYITGTVNQVAYPDTSFKLAIKLITTMMK
jgi:CubicO group peptidase (beta-lactamase class C family)